MRKVFFLAIIIIAGVCSPVLSQENSAPKPIEFTILYFNDVHGHLLPFSVDAGKGKKVHWGGLARLAGQVELIRSENKKLGKKTFLFYGGDLLMGTPISTVYRGEPGMLCFKEMGVQVFAVGNHEFDFGQKRGPSLAPRAKQTIPPKKIFFRKTSFPGFVPIVNSIEPALFSKKNEESKQSPGERRIKMSRKLFTLFPLIEFPNPQPA